MYAVDFFSGCGGTSLGFDNAGIKAIAGIDSDPDAISTYGRNLPTAQTFLQDIRELHTDVLADLIDPIDRAKLVFLACAPCQPFSKQRTHRPLEDGRVDLIWEFLRFVARYKPGYLFLENVPGLQSLSTQRGTFSHLVSELRNQGYDATFKSVLSQTFGVPQRRQRLILLASRNGIIDFPGPTHGPGTPNPDYSTVRAWIGALPPIKAGESHKGDPMHRSMRLSALNLERIRATPEGGGRRDWPSSLVPNCHSGSYSGHTDVYGRLKWDAPATGLTTRCISYSNGRFGHPDQDRAISLREAACLQTFPRSFRVHGQLTSGARQIGNAVPVLLAEQFGKHIINHSRRNT